MGKKKKKEGAMVLTRTVSRCGGSKTCWKGDQEKGEKRTNTIRYIVKGLLGKWRRKVVCRRHKASVSIF